MSRSSTTIATPFIYVKAQVGNKNIKKKVLLQTSFVSLMRHVTKLFKDIMVIKFLSSDDGTIIRKIDEFVSGDTYVALDSDPSTIPPPPINVAPKIIHSPVTKLGSQENSRKDYFIDSMDSFGNVQSSQDSLFSKPINIASTPISGKSSRLVIVNEQPSDEYSPVNRDKVYSTANFLVSKRELSDYIDQPEEVFLEEENQHEESEDFNEEESVNHETINEADAIYNGKLSGFVEYMQNFLGIESLKSQIENALVLMPKEYRQFIVRAIELEGIQMESWYCSMHNLIPSPSFEVSYFNNMLQSATNTFMKQTFLSSSTAISFIPHIGICGPNCSGKSTLLFTFFQQLLIHLLATELWKSTFIIYLNGSEISPSKNVFEYILTTTFASLELSLPNIKGFLPMLKKYLLSSSNPDDYLPMPKQFSQSTDYSKIAPSLKKIFQSLCQVFDNAPQYVFLSHILSLPSRIGTAFGLKNTIFIVDNIEKCDVDFVSNESGVNALSILKSVLSRSSYIFSCENQSLFIDSCGIASSDDINLFDQMITVSTTSIVSVENNQKLHLFVENGQTPLILTTEHLAGVPAYLCIWNQLLSLLDDNDQDGEIIIQINIIANKLISRLYNTSDINIINVKRVQD